MIYTACRVLVLFAVRRIPPSGGLPNQIRCVAPLPPLAHRSSRPSPRCVQALQSASAIPVRDTQGHAASHAHYKAELDTLRTQRDAAGSQGDDAAKQKVQKQIDAKNAVLEKMIRVDKQAPSAAEDAGKPGSPAEATDQDGISLFDANGVQARPSFQLSGEW